MKRICISVIPFLLAACFAQAQVNALLSIEGMGGNSSDDIIAKPMPTADGGVLLTFYSLSTDGGFSCSDNNTRTIVRKYNSDCTVMEWQRCFSASYAFVFLKPAGTFIVGYTGQTVDSAWQYVISEIDSNENIIWKRSYGGSAGDRLHYMIPAANGAYIMAGNSNSSDGDVGMHYGDMVHEDIWVLKVDSNGNKLWSTLIGGSDDDDVYSLCISPGNGCYVFGSTYSTDYDCIDNHGNKDGLICRLDSGGNMLWRRCLGGADEDAYETGSITGDGRGGVLIASDAFSPGGDITNHFAASDYWVLDVDSTGHINWSKCYGSFSYDYASAIGRAADGSIWVNGYFYFNSGQIDTTYSDHGKTDSWLMHADSNGNFLSGITLGEPDNDYGTVAFPLSNGTVLAAGSYYGAGQPGSGFPTNNHGLKDIFLARIAPWTTGVEQQGINDIGVQVFPNPASDKLWVNLGNSNYNELQIKDIFGSVLLSRTVATGRYEFDLRAWTRGIYYVQFSSRDSRYITRIVLM